jgi:N-methylhydantoinase A
MPTRLGVDVEVGGTFTNLIFYDAETVDVHVSKEPTTPVAPQEGVLTAVAVAAPCEELADAAFFLHGRDYPDALDS